MPHATTTHHMPAALAAPAPDPSSVSSVSSVVAPPPLPPRQRAFTLYCQGHRSPAIAARLGVPERTVRAWLAADLRALAAEQSPITRQELLQLAITRQLAIAAAAWDAYHQLCTAPPDDASVPDRSTSSPSSSDPSASSVSSVVALSAPGARYLRLAQAAYREIARLQGLYLPAPAEPQEVRIILERIPDDEPNLPADGMFPITSSPATPAESAMPTSPPPRAGASAGGAVQSAQADVVGRSPSGAVSTASRPPAESATSPNSSASSVLSVVPSPDPDALGLPRFRQRSRRPVPPLFAYRL